MPCAPLGEGNRLYSYHQNREGSPHQTIQPTTSPQQGTASLFSRLQSHADQRISDDPALKYIRAMIDPSASMHYGYIS